jgi:glycosyltransferase involved in cell wall biosynthesis
MPSISIIVPCYNEQTTIRKLLNAIYEQSTPRSDLEVIIADGMSSDGTRIEIADFQNFHPDLSITIVDNQRRSIPAGLNLAMKQAQGGIIIRLDAHSIPDTSYIGRCVQDLETGLGENVGGVWEIRSGANTWIAESIAAAAAHPIGVGDALYRHSMKAGAVDTVPFGAFKRELLATVGFFDESLLTNEDYEFNARIRKAGGKIWLDPAIRSVYFSRSDFSGLARQYFRYGFWKWRMLRRFPETIRWRQGLPPLFVLSVVGLGIAGAFLPLARALLGVELILYLLTLVASGLLEALRKGRIYLILGLPAAVAIMHICWGSGFLWSIIKGLFSNTDPERN